MRLLHLDDEHAGARSDWPRGMSSPVDKISPRGALPTFRLPSGYGGGLARYDCPAPEATGIRLAVEAAARPLSIR